jgi:thioredoxin-like negative regulator of GroEL
MFGPVFDQVMNETGVQHIKFDVDQKKDIAMSHMVSSIPTVIFESGNVVVHRQTGAMSRGQLLELIKKFS